MFSELESLHGDHVARLSRGAAQALAASGFDALVIHSGTPALRTRFDDIYWPLRPNPYLQHWLPLQEPGCALIVQAGTRPRLLRLLSSSYWEAPASSGAAHIFNAFDLVELTQPAQLRALLPRGRVAFVGEDLEAAAAWGYEQVNPLPLLQALDQLRVHKTPYEILCLAEANRRAAAGHDEVRALFAGADKAELSLHLAYLEATGQDDPETPYKNIVALGKHAATLHHVSYDKRGSGGQSLLLDAGASFAGYCSDVTRTWVKGGGVAASAFAGVVHGLERMQQELCAEATVGKPYEALHDEAHRKLAGVLRESAVSTLSEEELVSSGATRAFLPHGLGHSLGLVCHDVGCALVKPRAENPWLRNTSVIAEGQCFTIEPGIYFIDSLLAPLRGRPGFDWKLVDALALLGGVRIEDDLLVTATGNRNLTREVLPRGGGPVSVA
jgi:Xaa-Pro dipeptidase